jgi:hypothetical protein
LRSAVLALCLAGLLPVPLPAGEQRFAFAVPETEGRISLGVYDSAGKLVRTLFADAGQADFQIGLNGLITTWDGKDDVGAALPAGKYHVRGWLVADSVQAEGVAYHFNDWITDDASPEISGIGSLIPAEGEGFGVFGFRPGRGSGGAEAMLWRFSEEEGLKTVSPLPGKVGFLGGQAGRVAIQVRDESWMFLYKLTAPDSPLGFDGVYSSGAVWREALYLQPKMADKGELAVFPLAATAVPAAIPAPAPGLHLDANSSALLAWDGEKIWLRRDQAFVPAPVPELPVRFHVSAGPEETLWVAGRAGEDIVVRQHAFGGELLREMKIREDFATEVHVFASKSSLRFYLLLQSANWSRQTLRGYQPAAASSTPAEGQAVPVDWEVFLDKTIENSRRFGLRDGKLVADAREEPQRTEKKIGLPADPLTGKKSSVTLRAMTLPGGLWLGASDGLPLKKLSEIASFDRFVVTEGEGAESLRLFAGNGVVVAEYLVSGLGALVPIDAGEIELP